MTMRCKNPKHSHSNVVALHPHECVGAELGSLQPVGHARAQALADAVCKRSGVPRVSVEISFAPKGRRHRYQGWHCNGIQTSTALFQYPSVIVLNSYTRHGATLITLAHELAHHLTPNAGPPGGHGSPFPNTFRSMREYISSASGNK